MLGAVPLFEPHVQLVALVSGLVIYMLMAIRTLIGSIVE